MLFCPFFDTIEAKNKRRKKNKGKEEKGKVGLRIIYGKPGSGKSEYCFHEIINQKKEEKKIYMITPEQFSYTAENKLMKAANTRSYIKCRSSNLKSNGISCFKRSRRK